MKELSPEDLRTYERLKQARDYKGFKKYQIAEAIGLKEQTYGQKELGKEGGLEPYRLKKILDIIKIDARYIFGQMDDLIKADLEKPENNTDKQEMIEDFYNEWKEKQENKNPLCERLNTDNQLRECVELLIENRSSVSEVMGYLRIKNFAEGGEASENESA